jgi:NADPH:quinone reductase-like Zn-dependent oxidoreductase
MQELAPGTETINFREADVRKTLKDITDGRGPDVGIEAAGFHYVKGILHKVQSTVQSLLSCDKHGYLTISRPAYNSEPNANGAARPRCQRLRHYSRMRQHPDVM